MKAGILWEDEHFLIVNKPGGVLVEHLEEQLSNGTAERSSLLVHRLDRDVSGALLLAKTIVARELGFELFAEKTRRSVDGQRSFDGIAKQYVAVVHGNPRYQYGTLNKSIRDGDTTTTAVSQFRVIQRCPHLNASLLELMPLTGRRHQLRIHTSHELGCPIIGDTQYGGKNKFGGMDLNGNVMLHARSLMFNHPFTRRQVNVVAPLPVMMQSILRLFK